LRAIRATLRSPRGFVQSRGLSEKPPPVATGTALSSLSGSSLTPLRITPERRLPVGQYVPGRPCQHETLAALSSAPSKNIFTAALPCWPFCWPSQDRHLRKGNYFSALTASFESSPGSQPNQPLTANLQNLKKPPCLHSVCKPIAAPFPAPPGA